MPLVHVEQVRVQTVFTVIAFNEPVQKAEHGVTPPPDKPAT
jgi:hypothetical protein